MRSDLEVMMIETWMSVATTSEDAVTENTRGVCSPDANSCVSFRLNWKPMDSNALKFSTSIENSSGAFPLFVTSSVTSPDCSASRVNVPVLGTTYTEANWRICISNESESSPQPTVQGTPAD